MVVGKFVQHAKDSAKTWKKLLKTRQKNLTMPGEEMLIESLPKNFELKIDNTLRVYSLGKWALISADQKIEENIDRKYDEKDKFIIRYFTQKFNSIGKK